MRRSYFILVLIFVFYSFSVSADGYKFFDGYDTTKGSLNARTIDSPEEMERKKGSKSNKKGGKKGGNIGTDALGADDFDEFYPEANNVPNSPIAPPLFPCEPPVCTVLSNLLPANECEHKCKTGSHCQGRKDIRIGEGNIAVCVSD